MRKIANNLFALGLGAAVLGATPLPTMAASWTQPGATMGVPAGVTPPAGLYFIGDVNYGASSGSPSVSSGTAVESFLLVPGWSFLGASYAAGFTVLEPEVGVHNTSYIRGVFNPEILPVILSWNLGNGFYVSAASGVYVPLNSEVAFSTPGVTSGAAFEQRGAVSYVANDWIASVNTLTGITTADAAGLRQPDYLNIDATLMHKFGKWRLGPVGYAEWDLQTTPANAAVGRAFALGVGGQVAYDFGPVDLAITLTHQVDTHGDAMYGVGDTRVWATIVIPIWNPTPPAPKALVAKY
jgi:hypothetical protein